MPPSDRARSDVERSDRATDYVRSHVRNLVGAPVPSAWIEPELEARVFRELSRTPEVETPVRDCWGNWDFPFGESNRRGELYRPWLDLPVLELRRRMQREHPGTALEPMWPGGRRFAVCLTHDVDYITLNVSLARNRRQIARDLRLAFDASGDRGAARAALRNVIQSAYQIATLRWLKPNRERSYDEWIQIEDRHGFKSTFFFFPERLTDPHVYDCLYRYDDPMRFEGRDVRVREWARLLASRGWEVGLHGSYHSALRPGLLEDQKRQIEDLVGRAVTSTRQHWLHYDVRVTPRLQERAGLQVDSTQGFNRNIGFRAGTCFPYPCWDFERAEPMGLLELPQHIMDGALFTTNALEYDVDLAVRHSLELMSAVEEVGGCLTLSWHPNSIQYPAYWAVYEALLAEAARRGAWGCSAGELAAWWRERAARIAARPPAAS